MNCQHASIREILDGPVSASFGGRLDGTVNDRRSFYAGASRLWHGWEPADVTAEDHPLSFDISNNRILASVDIEGTVRTAAIVHGVEPAYGADLRGTYVHKTMTLLSPALRFRIGRDDTMPLEPLPVVETSLLSGFLPRSTFTWHGLTGTILSFAPAGDNGSACPRAIVTLVHLRNLGETMVSGQLWLPGVHGAARTTSPAAATEHGESACIALLDGSVTAVHWREQAFVLAPDEEFVAAIAMVLGGSSAEMDDTVSLLRGRSTSQWLEETLTYRDRNLGELTVSPDNYWAEFLQRQAELCRQSGLLDDDGRFAGTFWGSDANPRPDVWMKDAFYTALPWCWLEPELCREAILFFARWGLPPQPWDRGVDRFPGALGVVHSLGNAVSAIALAGSYYQATGDRTFFLEHPEVYQYGVHVLAAILESRRGDVFLFPSMYISDGDARGDYHTGSNVIVRHAFMSMARLGSEVFGDEAASAWSDAARRIQAAIWQHCAGPGPRGLQLFEGAYLDGSFVPGHDGEESDLTLAPLLGFCDAGEPALIRHAQLAFTPLNPYYSPALDSVCWYDAGWCGPTFPAYIHALAGARDNLELADALERIRRRVDLDGSTWWWPHEQEWTDKARVKRGPGKCGWAAGVFVARFVHDIIGLAVDVPAKRLEFRPLSPWPAFTWKGLHLGAAHMDVTYRQESTAIQATLTNRMHDTYDTTLEITLPKSATPHTYLVNEEAGHEEVRLRERYDRCSIVVSRAVPPGQSLRLEVTW